MLFKDVISTKPVTVAGPVSSDSEDLYIKFKVLQKQLEFLQVQEDYIKDELKNLRMEYLYAQEEVKRIQSVPLVIGQFLEAVDQNYAIVGKLGRMKLIFLKYC